MEQIVATPEVSFSRLAQFPATLPEIGWVRLPQILAVIPVSKATWYTGIREGKYPPPTKKFGPRISVWNVQDIRALCAQEQE